MSAQLDDNRRSDPRFDVQIRVDYDTQGMFTSNNVTNISRGGVFVQTKDPLPLFSEITLTLILPGLNTTIKAKGKVTWTYDIKKGTSAIISGMGIKFTQLPSDQRQILENYIQDLTQPLGKDNLPTA